MYPIFGAEAQIQTTISVPQWVNLDLLGNWMFPDREFFGFTPGGTAIGGPDMYYGSTPIEVKTGRPFEGKSKLKSSCLYIVLTPDKYPKGDKSPYLLHQYPSFFTVRAIAWGWQVLKDGKEPTFEECPRKNKHGKPSHLDNWKIFHQSNWTSFCKGE